MGAEKLSDGHAVADACAISRENPSVTRINNTIKTRIPAASPDLLDCVLNLILNIRNRIITRKARVPYCGSSAQFVKFFATNRHIKHKNKL